LIASDAATAMVGVAMGRARDLGVSNVEFKRLELEWIDLPAASVDAALCRWGFMLCVDPAAAFAESRRVLRPGGRLALAVWDSPERNPWATIPGRALVQLGHAEPPDPNAPGMFALAAPGRLQQLLESAGFVEVIVESVELNRQNPSVEQYVGETRDLARPFAEVFEALTPDEQEAVKREIAALAEPFAEADGSLRFPARSLVAAANG
jgi:ubiquinone/menaquinone biosynthesis C-methylase UbiE